MSLLKWVEKNAIIVDADADLDEAVLHILQSAFGYQGQKCSACSRLIALEENYNKLVERLKTTAESIELGPVEDPKNFMGDVIDDAAQRRILRYIQIGKKKRSSWLSEILPIQKVTLCI